MITSLPKRSLSIQEVESLDEGDTIAVCKPLLGVSEGGEPIENIIALYLGHGETVHILVYERRDKNWVRLDSLTTTDTMGRFDEAAELVLAWADRSLDSSDVSLLTTATEHSLHDTFPRRPLGKQDINEFSQLPGVGYIHPLFCIEETHEIIAVLWEEHRISKPEPPSLNNAGFNRDAEEWEVVERVQLTSDDHSAEQISDSIHQWLTDQYPETKLLAIQPDPV